MGRATELFDFINRKESISQKEEELIYSSLTIDDSLRKFRTDYQKSLTEYKKSGLISNNDGTFNLW